MKGERVPFSRERILYRLLGGPWICVITFLWLTMLSCAPENRSETRAVISGSIVLHNVDGLNDMSRVRVDIGRGEGGTAPKEDGSFTFQDLEPDEYKLVVTYSGGLTPTTSKSAYAPFSQIVQAGLGGNVNLGNLSLKLATGTVEGAVVTSDGANADGAEVTLTEADGIVRRARVVEGKYTIAEVPVGYHEMEVRKDGYATAAAQTVCRPEVIVEEGDSVVTPPAVTLAQSTPSFTPGFGEVGEVLGTTWFVSGDAVTIRVDAAYATEGRIWWNDSETPDWSSFQADGYVVEEIPNGSTTAHLQLRNRCGFESPVYDLSLVRDISAPIVTEVRGPSSRQDSEGRTWLTESGATVQLVVSAVDDFSSIAGFAVYHDAENSRGSVEDLVFQDVSANGTAATTILPVALTEGEGEKLVSVYAKDRSGNISESFEIEFRVDSIEPVIQRFALASGRAWTTEPSPTFVLEAEDEGGLSQLQTSLSGTFTGSPGPYLSSFPVSVVPPSEDGNREVFVRVWDEAGNMAETSLVLRLDRQAPTATVTTATGQRAFATAGPVSIRIVHDVDAARVALGFSEEACGGGAWSAVDGVVETHRDVELSGEDGIRTLRVCVEDAAGNANSYTLALVLDTQAPEGFLRVAEDAAYTKTAEVSVLLNAADAQSMRLGESPASGLLEVGTLCADVAGPAYVPFATRSAVTLKAEGERQVWACLRDEAGNTSLVSDGIVFDETPPRIDVFEVQGEATVTKNEAPLFRLSAIDVHSGVKGMQTSLSGLFSGSPSPYQTSFPLSIVPPEEDGTRAVFVRVWDEAGNHTTTSYSIRLDRIAPSATLQTLTGQTAFSEPGPVTIRVLHDSDATRVALGMGDETCGGGAWSEVDNDTESQRTVELSGADGVRVVRGCVEDEAGNRRTASLGLAIDSTAPDGSIAVNGGAAYATDATVSVSLSSTESVTVRLGESDGAATLSTATTCSGTEGYAAFRSREQIQLSAEGPRAVWACLQDGAGHTALLKTTIHLDLIDPVLTSVKVADGNAIGTDGATRVLSFATSIEIEGEGASWMKVTSTSLADVPWQPFGRYVPFTFIPPDGPRVIRVQLKDDAGRVSQVVEVPVELLTTGSIAGRVNLETGGDASLLEALVPGTSLRVGVSASGDFLLAGVSGGAQILRIQSTDVLALAVAPTDFAAVVVPGDTTDLGVVQLQRARGSVGGGVLSEEGEPLGGVLVEAVGSSRNELSDSAGDYLLEDVPTGTYTIRFSLAAHEAVEVPGILVERDTTTTVPTQTLTLIRGAMVGTALREDADALGIDHSGIEVTVFGNGNNQSTITGASGVFRVEGLKPGFYNVEAKADAYLPREKNGIYLTGGVDNEAGTFTLERRKGLLSGTVTAEGGKVPVGALVTLIVTGYSTEVDGAGRYELRVPVGNYDGVRVAYEYFQDDSYDETVTVAENGSFTVPVLHLLGASGCLSGTVTLAESAAGLHGGIRVHLEGKPGTRAYRTELETTTDADGNFSFGADTSLFTIVDAPAEYLNDEGDFIFTGIPTGQWTMTLEPPGAEREAGRETAIREVEVVAGQETVSVVELRNLYLLINDNDEVTTSESVTLTFGATGCAKVRVALENQSFEEAPEYSCNQERVIELGETQGEREVFARYFDADGNRLGDTSDTILLDSRAEILSVNRTPNAAKVGYGTRINFVVQTSEAGGEVWVRIDGYESRIELHEGGEGCGANETGCYGAIYDILKRIDVNAAAITANFTDAYGNEASASSAPLTIGISPLITDFEIEPDLALENAIVRFTTDERSTGQVFIGQASGDLCSDEAGGACPPSSPNLLNHTQTVNGLHAGEATASLERGKPYYVQVRATDAQGNEGYSPIREFFLRPNPPGRVIAMPGIQRAHVRWEAPPQLELMGYRVERSQDAGTTWTTLAGPDCQMTFTGAYTHEALLYEDTSAAADVTYRYRITALDAYCNESDGAESQDITPAAANQGPTLIPQGILQNLVWTEIGSPYEVQGNIRVREGDTLVVGPNTRVDMPGGSKIQVLGHIGTYGGRGSVYALDFNGFPLENADNAVRFVSVGLWGGIELEGPLGERPNIGVGGYRSGDFVYRTSLQSCTTCIAGSGYAQTMRSAVAGGVTTSRGVIWGTHVGSHNGNIDLVDSSDGNTRYGHWAFNRYDASNICPKTDAGCNNLNVGVSRSRLRGYSQGRVYDTRMVLPSGGSLNSGEWSSSFIDSAWELVLSESIRVRGSRLPSRVKLLTPEPGLISQSRIESAVCALETELRAGFDYEQATLVLTDVHSDCPEGTDGDTRRIYDGNEDILLGQIEMQTLPPSAYPRVLVEGPSLVTPFALGRGITLYAHGDDSEEGALPEANAFWTHSTGGPAGNGAFLTLPANLPVGFHTYHAHVTDGDGLESVIPWVLEVTGDGAVARDYTFPDASRWRISTLRFEDLPASAAEGPASSFQWVCEAADCQVMCSLDEATVAPCRSPLELAGLAAGEHTLRFEAQSTSGEPLDLPYTYTWRVPEPRPVTRHPAPLLLREFGGESDTHRVSLPGLGFWAGSKLVATCSVDGKREWPCSAELLLDVNDANGAAAEVLTVRARRHYTGEEAFASRSLRLNDPADLDGDGWEDTGEKCEDHADNHLDVDGDGIGDTCDNCPLVANEDQVDANSDGVGDACDVCTGADLHDDGIGTCVALGSCASGYLLDAWGRCVSAGGTPVGGPFGMDFSRIPEGSFLREGHEVSFTYDFAMGVTEVTQKEWMALTGGGNPARFQSCGIDCPVEQVDWYSVVGYANALSEREGLERCYTLEGCSDVTNGWKDGGHSGCTRVTFKGLDCTGYRLPTEAEWEYAYRAGTTTVYYNGDSDAALGDIAWYQANSNNTSHPVGQKLPNAWGLYDMAGSVNECTWDWYGIYPGETTNYVGPETGDYRVCRGGSWYNFAHFAQAEDRTNKNDPGGRNSSTGFRLTRTLP